MLYNEIAIGTPEEWKYVMYSQLNRFHTVSGKVDPFLVQNDTAKLEDVLTKEFYGYDAPVVISNFYDYKKFKQILQFVETEYSQYLKNPKVMCEGTVFYATKQSFENKTPEEVFGIRDKRYQLEEVGLVYKDKFYHRFFQFKDKNLYRES